MDIRLKLMLWFKFFYLWWFCVWVVDQVKFVESNTKQNGIWALQQ